MKPDHKNVNIYNLLRFFPIPAENTVLDVSSVESPKADGCNEVDSVFSGDLDAVDTCPVSVPSGVATVTSFAASVTEMPAIALLAKTSAPFASAFIESTVSNVGVDV